MEEPEVKKAVRSYLEHKGYSVTPEWLIQSYWWDDIKPDLVGVKNGTIVLEFVDEPKSTVMVECKGIRGNLAEGIGKTQIYHYFSQLAYLAIPEEIYSHKSFLLGEICKKGGFGLLTVQHIKESGKTLIKTNLKIECPPNFKWIESWQELKAVRLRKKSDRY